MFPFGLNKSLRNLHTNSRGIYEVSMNKCPRCGKQVPKLFPLDDADTTSQYSGLLGVPYPCTEYLCIKCLNKLVGISREDVINEERLEDNIEFNINLLKGNIAQSIISMIFRDCGYEVYPFGYESYLTNIIRRLRKGDNTIARNIRSSPDILVYDRGNNDCFLVEIKATNAPDESNYEMLRYSLERYKKYWDEATLVIYCIRTANIYCKSFNEIDIDSLNRSRFKNTERESCVLDLKNTFLELPKYFRLIDENRYYDLISRIREVIQQFDTKES